MIFKFLFVNTEKIIYKFSFYKEIREVLVREVFLETKNIDYLFAVLQITKRLSSELKEQILYKYLISEFKDKYFINIFEKELIENLSLDIEIDNLEDTDSENTEDINYYSDLDSWYYQSD